MSVQIEQLPVSEMSDEKLVQLVKMFAEMRDNLYDRDFDLMPENVKALWRAVREEQDRRVDRGPKALRALKVAREALSKAEDDVLATYSPVRDFEGTTLGSAAQLSDVYEELRSARSTIKRIERLIASQGGAE